MLKKYKIDAKQIYIKKENIFPYNKTNVQDELEYLVEKIHTFHYATQNYFSLLSPDDILNQTNISFYRNSSEIFVFQTTENKVNINSGNLDTNVLTKKAKISTTNSSIEHFNFDFNFSFANNDGEINIYFNKREYFYYRMSLKINDFIKIYKFENSAETLFFYDENFIYEQENFYDYNFKKQQNNIVLKRGSESIFNLILNPDEISNGFFEIDFIFNSDNSVINFKEGLSLDISGITPSPLI